ncbi:unnamed protein product [Phytophthora fragariaefolia]|uniref:Unnamed protein product n=1 Tax=Phytophthora fragariaefolia TaxID=1490495 RepID=A0A9W7CV71_9STRA|nr:unnamed protein product [Phytophthora fragariaefolia]
MKISARRLPFADESVAQEALRDTGMAKTKAPCLEEDDVSASETSASSRCSRRRRKSKGNRSGRRRLRRRPTAADPAPSSESFNVVEYSEGSPNRIRTVEVANPPSDAATITRPPGLSWKYFLRDLKAGEIEQVCLLTGSDHPAVLTNVVSDDDSAHERRRAHPVLSRGLVDLFLADPQKPTALRQWLGLANYLPKYTKDYAGLIQPMSSLLKKDVAWEWRPKHQDAFDAVKKGLASAPVLMLPIKTVPRGV